MLVSDVIAHVRDLLQDWDDKKRYQDDSLLRLVNLSMLEIARVRPDHFIGAFDVATPQYTLLSDEIQVPETAFPAVIKYVAGMAELRDDEYTTDGRAAALLQAFSVDMGLR
jgi:hypothetical protein